MPFAQRVVVDWMAQAKLHLKFNKDINGNVRLE
ncbi:MAG: hypothetical protein ACI9V8_000512 [Urechidicola sp.]|jgi:hypothetical protein